MLSNSFDVSVVGVRLYFLPIETRIPLKFGAETLTSVTCARACVTVEDADGRRAEGWGECPLSVQWVWPADISYGTRHELLKQLCLELASQWENFGASGHALELGNRFQSEVLPSAVDRFSDARPGQPRVPYLAALLCVAPIDIAVHDAYGKLHGLTSYETYGAPYLSQDLATYFDPDGDCAIDFHGRYPSDYLTPVRPAKLPAWHLVGGLDALTEEDLDGTEPDDGHPVILSDWIQRDGLECLKVKLRGNDAEWDYRRLRRVATIAEDRNVQWLTADYNCMVTEPAYVTDMLDRLERDDPIAFERILYVEQPFPYDLHAHRIDVRTVSERKPLLMDESAHDWRHVRLGQELGWNGVALKTCKTQTGAILSLCWAKANGLHVMVQDLTNPMLAQIPHVLLAAHADTMHGVETNAMQFYPAASDLEAKVHPGLYRRRDGYIDLTSIQGPGFGYRLEEVRRELPEAAFGD